MHSGLSPCRIGDESFYSYSYFSVTDDVVRLLALFDDNDNTCAEKKKREPRKQGKEKE